MRSCTLWWTLVMTSQPFKDSSPKYSCWYLWFLQHHYRLFVHYHIVGFGTLLLPNCLQHLAAAFPLLEENIIFLQYFCWWCNVREFERQHVKSKCASMHVFLCSLLRKITKTWLVGCNFSIGWKLWAYTLLQSAFPARPLHSSLCASDLGIDNNSNLNTCSLWFYSSFILMDKKGGIYGKTHLSSQYRQPVDNTSCYDL